MAISNVNQGAYNSYVYQWQNQKLQNTGTTTNGGSSLGNYAYNGISSVASMVELTRYAMNAMGVGANERVTFSQVQKYKGELEAGFSADIKKGLAGFGVAPDASFSATVGQDGRITVDSTHPDKAKIQSYIDAHPEYGQQIRKDLKDKGVEDTVPVKFNVSSTGTVTMVPHGQSSLQNYFDENAVFGKELNAALLELGVDTSKPFSLVTDENGALTVSGDHPDKEKIAQYLADNPQIAADVQEIFEKLSFPEGTKATFTITNAKVSVKVSTQTEDEKAIAEYLSSKDYGTIFKNGLAGVGVDPNTPFRLTLDANGKIKVAGDHPDIAKIQKFFDDNPELAKKYQQIQALADLDAARKAMSVNPTAMRKRIEMESMAAWWGSTGNAGASIGDFTGGNLSVLAGVNRMV